MFRSGSKGRLCQSLQWCALGWLVLANNCSTTKPNQLFQTQQAQMSVHTLYPCVQKPLPWHKYCSRGVDLFGLSGTDVMVYLSSSAGCWPKIFVTPGATYEDTYQFWRNWAQGAGEQKGHHETWIGVAYCMYCTLDLLYLCSLSTST
jgi:hypothetical protein